MLSNLTHKPATDATVDWAVEPYVGLAANQHMSAPVSATQGTALSAAGRTAVIDLPGSTPPREAPV